jgi:hypothetical protein
MQWWDANRAPVNRACWVQLLAGESAPLLSSEPNRHSFRIKPDTRADPEGWESIRLPGPEKAALPGISEAFR